MEKIVVPIDFSKFSIYALKIGVSIAQKYECELVLFNVIEPSFKGDQQQEMRRIKSEFDDLVKHINCSDVLLSKTIATGEYIPEIINYVEQHYVDLIVTGSHGVNGYRESIFGTNTLKVLRKVPCPVLVTKNDVPSFELDKVIFASNFNRSNIDPFKKFIQLIAPFTTEMHLLNINTPGFFFDPGIIMKKAMEKYEAYAKQKGLLTISHREEFESVEKGVIKLIETISPDLIILSTRGRNTLSHLFTSSIAEALVNKVNTPVMTIKV